MADFPVNATQLAHFLGIKTQTLTRLIADGLPIAERGGPGKGHVFDLKAIHAWDLQRAAENRAANKPVGRPANPGKERISEIDAEMKLIELAKARGEMILVAEILPFLNERMVQIRGDLLNVCNLIESEFGKDVSARVASLIREAMENLVLAEEDRQRAEEEGDGG